MELLKQYFDLQQRIYDYFGYVEDWVVIPLDDRTEFLWYIDMNEVVYADKMEDFATGDYYADEIYKQRFLPKWTYTAEDYTMICVDTHTDGNRFLAIFDNSKRLEETPELG